MIHIEHRRLCALEQDAAALPPRLAEQFPALVGVRQDLRRHRAQRGEQFGPVDLGLVETAQ